MKLPPQYTDLLAEDAPRMVREALAEYGTFETPGTANNPKIVGWGNELGGWIDRFYTDDSIPWCGLFMAVCAKRAAWEWPQQALSARSWAEWGTPQKTAMLGDVLVFSRKGGGHVGLYVGETGMFYHVLGGNQSDSVCITLIAKSRCIAIRRAPWRTAQPASVKVIKRSNTGAAISTNEA